MQAEEFEALVTRVRDFIDGEVIPAEDLQAMHDPEKLGKTVTRLRQRARELGLGAHACLLPWVASGSPGSNVAAFSRKWAAASSGREP